jgi:hypothetical protein
LGEPARIYEAPEGPIGLTCTVLLECMGGILRVVDISGFAAELICLHVPSRVPAVNGQSLDRSSLNRTT